MLLSWYGSDEKKWPIPLFPCRNGFGSPKSAETSETQTSGGNTAWMSLFFVLKWMLRSVEPSDSDYWCVWYSQMEGLTIKHSLPLMRNDRGWNWAKWQRNLLRKVRRHINWTYGPRGQSTQNNLPIWQKNVPLRNRGFWWIFHPLHVSKHFEERRTFLSFHPG